MGLSSIKRGELSRSRTQDPFAEHLSVIPAQKKTAPQPGVRYGRPAAEPRPTVRVVRSWKRVTMFSCFAAAGFGFAVARMAGAAYWYRFTPTAAPKPWNTKAIQASYVGTTMTEQTKGSRLQAKFVFDVCNTTQSDYTLQAESSDALVVMQKVRSEATLVDGIGLTWTVDHGSGIGQYHAAGIPGLPR